MGKNEQISGGTVRLFIAFLLLVSISFGQSTPPAKPKPKSSRQGAVASSKPAAPKVNYLTGPLDLATSNLGLDFHGHNIVALFDAIKDSPALKTKSEFETTALFELRRKKFTDQPILGTLTPSNYFAFVVPTDSLVFAPEFKYDADSQTLEFLLKGSTNTFYLESEHPKLDTILIHSTVLDRGQYVASNAFGAKIEVDKTYSRDNGIAFSKYAWLFRSSDAIPRTFSYLFNMTPDQARTMKEAGKVVVICRLLDPWLHDGVHGHEAKIDEPYETTVADNYLEVDPEQLWIFNQQTGEVLAKLSETSVVSAQNEQLRIQVKQTPLILEVSSPRLLTYTVTIDGKPGHLEALANATTFRARQSIIFKVDYPDNLSNISFKLNGKSYTPDWRKDSSYIGKSEYIHSATATITLP